jgi:hypothetical protein
MEEFLRLLGHDLSGTISIRGFYPSTDDRAKADRGRHIDSTLKMCLKRAQEWSAEGRSIYAVPNGPGKNDKSIKFCRAVFFEHDALGKELSMGLWEGLGLPRPSFQVDTGGKSVHSYWVLSEPIEPDLWRALQAELIEFADADRANKNPSRVMRCPGYRHPETGQMAEIINATDARYSYAELRAIVPSIESEAPRAPMEAPQEVRPAGVEDGVSIAPFLAVGNRRVLDGVSHGERNALLLKFGLDLVGVERWLQSEGEWPCDRASDLFYNACLKCSPPMGSLADDPQPEQFWGRICKESNGPTLSDDKLRNILNVQKQKSAKTNRSLSHDIPDELAAEFEAAKAKVDFNSNLKSHFESDFVHGLQYIKVTYDKTKGQQVEQIYVGYHLIVLACAHSPEDDGYSVQLEFKTLKGIKTLTLKRLLFEGEGKEALELLVDNGYSYNRESRKLLLTYLSSLGKNVDKFYIISDKTGWVADGFVLPDRSFGNQDLRFQQVELPKIPMFQENGTLEEWKSNIGEMAINNSRLTFAIGVALSAPLNPVVGAESGGWHFCGLSGGGKTVALEVAASVYGLPKRQISSWRATSNALEFKAASRNHLALFLDELNEAVPQAAAEAAYMLANGQGKSRLHKDLRQREVQQWELVFLSTGELNLSNFLEQGGIHIKGGQETRMPSIPAFPSSDRHSLFEQHMGMEPVVFVKQLEQACKKYTGTAFTAFMQYLVDSRCNEFDARLRSRHAEIRAELVNGHDPTNVLLRVADRMAVVQLALEIAHEQAIIPHQLLETQWPIKVVFDDWVADRGGEKDFELMRQCAQIERLFVTNEFSDRIVSVDDWGKGDRVTRNLLAYKITDGYAVPPPIFNSVEFSGDVNKTVLKKELIDRGWLVPGPDGRPDTRPYIGGKRQRSYVFRRFWQDE